MEIRIVPARTVGFYIPETHRRPSSGKEVHADKATLTPAGKDRRDIQDNLRTGPHIVPGVVETRVVVPVPGLPAIEGDPCAKQAAEPITDRHLSRGREEVGKISLSQRKGSSTKNPDIPFGTERPGDGTNGKNIPSVILVCDRKRTRRIGKHKQTNQNYLSHHQHFQCIINMMVKVIEEKIPGSFSQTGEIDRLINYELIAFCPVNRTINPNNKILLAPLVTDSDRNLNLEADNCSGVVLIPQVIVVLSIFLRR